MVDLLFMATPLTTLEYMPRLSVRQRSAELQIPKSSVHNILKRDGYKPFKPAFTQFLTEEDEYNRMWADSLKISIRQEIYFSGLAVSCPI